MILFDMMFQEEVPTLSKHEKYWLAVIECNTCCVLVVFLYLYGFFGGGGFFFFACTCIPVCIIDCFLIIVAMTVSFHKNWVALKRAGGPRRPGVFWRFLFHYFLLSVFRCHVKLLGHVTDASDFVCGVRRLSVISGKCACVASHCMSKKGQSGESRCNGLQWVEMWLLVHIKFWRTSHRLKTVGEMCLVS